MWPHYQREDSKRQEEVNRLNEAKTWLGIQMRIYLTKDQKETENYSKTDFFVNEFENFEEINHVLENT